MIDGELIENVSTMATSTHSSLPFVTAPLSFFKPLQRHQTEKPYEILINLSEEQQSRIPRSNLAFENHDCRIYDARSQMASFTLDQNGFAFGRHRSKLEYAAFKEKDQVEQRYLPEMEKWLADQLGGKVDLIKIFDYRLRSTLEASDRGFNLDDGMDPLIPSVHPHVDQSAIGARRRAHHHLDRTGINVDDLILNKRLRIINIWRPLRRVRCWPLTACDTQSVDPRNLIPNDIVRRKYVGEALYAAYDERMIWYYLSDQNETEVTMMKIFDSREDVVAKFCVHTSFNLESHVSNVDRESIEVRALVIG